MSVVKLDGNIHIERADMKHETGDVMVMIMILERWGKVVKE